MKTEELIAMLASGVTSVDTDAPRKRFQTALAWGGLGAVVVMLLGYGVRPDLAQAAALPMLWVKLAFPLAIAIPAALLTLRLSRPGMRVGKTWLSCAFNIAFVSAPVLLGMLWAVKGLAPTRPALAGACAGLASAAAGAVVYALHCPEMQAPFLAVWYALGMLVPTAVGAVVVAKLLRW